MKKAMKVMSDKQVDEIKSRSKNAREQGLNVQSGLANPNQLIISKRSRARE